jgi:hypothetical protein
MGAVNAMVIDFKPAWRARHAGWIQLPHYAGDDLDYRQRPAVGRQRSRSGFAQNRILASSPCHHIQHHGPAWPGRLHGVQWDGKTTTSFPLNETDEKKAMQALLLKNPLEEAANASDREINATRKTVMSEHDKNLFIEQHNNDYAILRGGRGKASCRRADAGCGDWEGQKIRA